LAKRQRRDQQHLRQQAPRKKTYTLGGEHTAEKMKPPFPMNLMQNSTAFWVVGAVIMIGGLFAAIFASSNGSNQVDSDLPTPTPVTPTATPDPNATPTPTATPDPKKFTAADKVIDAAAKDYSAVLKTDKGEITIKLFDDKSPNTVNAFVFLAQKKYFDNISFHRVVADFVVQGGDPTGTGGGGPGFETEQEANEFKNLQGYVSMARAAGSTKFGSQFFINLKDNPSLDQDAPNQKRFYPFGQVTKGMDVVNQIKQGDKIQSVTIVETPQGQ